MAIDTINIGSSPKDGTGDDLRTAGGKINSNFSDPNNAASYLVGGLTGQIPTVDDLSGGAFVDSSVVNGTVSFSSDVYTFAPVGGNFPTLQAGMIVRFRLPATANTTTTPTADYDGTSYNLKWIDGSAFAAGDLDNTKNKHALDWYVDGTDFLLASDLSGSNANGQWLKQVSGEARATSYEEAVQVACTTPSGEVFASSSLGGDSTPISFNSVSYKNVFIEGTDTDSTTRWAVSDNSVSGSSAFASYRVVDSISSTADVNISKMVIGRWY